MLSLHSSITVRVTSDGILGAAARQCDRARLAGGAATPKQRCVRCTNQDHEAIEVIVVDDAHSPGATVGAIRRYLEREDVRARFRRTVVHRRAWALECVARNQSRVFAKPKVDYVNLLEAGDTLRRAASHGC